MPENRGDAHPEPEHLAVLVTETVELLAPRAGSLVVDCTLGLGGHARALLESEPGLRLIGIDRDREALDVAAERLGAFGDRVELAAGDFGSLDEVLDGLGIESVDGILADLGISSLQLDRPERGFSFQREGPLDMRMGLSETTARDIVNSYPEVELNRILKQYGEEREAGRIAAAIVRHRERQSIETTRELRRVVVEAKRKPRPGARQRIDPATRVFQALRIEVNRELANLENLLEQGIRRLESEGRIVIISYHSLEDRIVKNVFRDAARGEVDPVTGRSIAESQILEVMTRRPIRPGEAEIAANPRSRSARLRAARRL